MIFTMITKPARVMIFFHNAMPMVPSDLIYFDKDGWQYSPRILYSDFGGTNDANRCTQIVEEHRVQIPLLGVSIDEIGAAFGVKSNLAMMWKEEKDDETVIGGLVFRGCRFLPIESVITTDRIGASGEIPFQFSYEDFYQLGEESAPDA